VTSAGSEQRAAVCVAVIDEGPGVPSAERESIWRPFQRGTAARDGAGGSGIGLTVVKEIVDDHQGRVWVDAAANGGATFVVELPIEPTVERHLTSSESRTSDTCGVTSHA
jgi:signal transduction histidine kinase